MADLTVQELADAMQRAWDEFCADTGCIPSEFTIHGPGTTRVVASFGRGEFARMVFDELDRPAIEPQPADAPVPQGTQNPLLDKLCKRCGVIAAYCPCDEPDLAPLPDAEQGTEDTDYRTAVARAIHEACWRPDGTAYTAETLADAVLSVRDAEVARLRAAYRRDMQRNANLLQGHAEEIDRLRAELAEAQHNHNYTDAQAAAETTREV